MTTTNDPQQQQSALGKSLLQSGDDEIAQLRAEIVKWRQAGEAWASWHEQREAVEAEVAQLRTDLAHAQAERDAIAKQGYDALANADHQSHIANHLRVQVEAMRGVVEAARKDAESDDAGCDCLTHQALAALDQAQPKEDATVQ